MISTDRKIFEENSFVRSRITQYGELFEELHVIVFSMNKLGFKKSKYRKEYKIVPNKRNI